MGSARPCAATAWLAIFTLMGCGPKVSNDEASGSASGGGSGSERDGGAGSGRDDSGGGDPTASGTTTASDTTTASGEDVGPIENCEINAGVAWASPGNGFGIGGSLPSDHGGANSVCGAPGSEVIFRMNVSETTRVVGSVTVGRAPGILSIREDCDSTVELAYGCDGELETKVDPGEYIVIVDQPSEDGGSFDIQLTFE